MALPVKALKAGQEAYWLDQIARNREEYFSGRGESPGRFVGSAAHASGLEGVASAEQVRAMFQGLDPATGEVRCAPLWRADSRSKLAAGSLLDALKARAAERGVEDPEALARSKALKGDVRSVQAACRAGGTRRVKVETVERLCRKVLRVDPRSLYGEVFDKAWQHKGKRVERITDSRITADGRAGDPACAEAGGGRCVGVFLFDGGRALIRNNTISSPGAGISFQGRSFGGDSVLDNRVACPGSGAARHASGCIDSAGSPGGNVLVGNSVSALISDGITIAGQSGDTVTGNSVDGTTDGSGIVLLEVTNSTVRDNVAMDNGEAFGSGGYGMFVSGDANLIKRNTASRNAGDGIFSSGAGTLVANVARDNGGLGIQAVDGAIDGGRNRASGNADPQCLGVSCTP